MSIAIRRKADTTRSWPSWRRSFSTPPLWLVLPVGLVGLATLLPLAFVLAQAGQAGWSQSVDLLFRPYTGGLLLATLQLLGGVTAGSLLLGVGLAWLVERSDVPGARVWGIALPLSLAVPSFVTSFTWVSLSARFEGMNSAIAILSLAEFPLIYLPVAAALRGMDQSLDDVACSLGHSPWRRFTGVTLPQLRPAISGAALLVMLHMLVEFGPLALLRVDTFTTAIYAAFELEFNSASAAVLSAVLLVLCGLIVLAEMRLRGTLRFARIGSGASRRPTPIRLGLWRFPAMAFLATVVALALGVPLVSLGYWMLVGSSTAFPVGRIAHALFGTLQLAGVGSLVTTAAGLALVFTAIRFRGAISRLAERLPFVIHALPGVVVALALVFFTLSVVPALYQTMAVLVLAYALLSLPLAQSAIRAVLEQFPASIEDAARSCGRGPWAVFVRVTLPNIATGLGAALILVFLSLLRELTATLILSPTGTDTLSMEVWSHTSKMEYGAAAPYALLLVLLSGIPAYLFGRRLRRGGASR
ncbi:iron ABC transporter permease [Lichenihabitans sp. PAMC28606]|uniref:ABC transporter permease n=1 Tax=Lichenihabitans sp. PAMC28606 TaxID=2880932 RepID=UPI001D0B6D60|nr:iron ABC transporter permease [Lichenihabitans sp. PAMC28606]UDL95969.1 iron ABC transporter permease [Lichenihabitans sp. PAMC28606]